MQMIRLIAHITYYTSVITIFIPFICTIPALPNIFVLSLFFLELFCFFEDAGASFSSLDNEVFLLPGEFSDPFLFGHVSF